MSGGDAHAGARARATGSVAVVGAAGGVGASTVAAGLALAWASRRERVWLADLDSARGDLAAGWDLPGRRTVDDLAPVAAEADARHLERAASEHGSGVRVIAAAGALAADGAWDPPRATAACDALCAAGAVVADVSGDGPLARAMVHRADSVLLVCPATLDGLRRAVRLVDGWRDGPVMGRLGLVWMRGRGAPEVGSRALGRAVGAHVVATLPRSAREARAIRSGSWPHGRRARLAGALARLAEALP